MEKDIRTMTKKEIEEIVQGIADEFKKDGDPLSNIELAYIRIGVATAVKCMNAVHEKLIQKGWY
ncbi:MAG: hypothetical protein VW683_10025 [Betaproteobacteria bacterium]